MRLLPVFLVMAALLLVAAPANAITTPRDCGSTTVKGKRYKVKADQVSCSTSKRHARRYLSTGRRPSGYKCRNYPDRKRRVKFMCSRGVRTFLAIRL